MIKQRVLCKKPLPPQRRRERGENDRVSQREEAETSLFFSSVLSAPQRFTFFSQANDKTTPLKLLLYSRIPDPLVKPTVAHLHRLYLSLSETFIHQYITHMRRYRPIMLARRTANLDAFPFSPVYAVDRLPRPLQVWNYLAFRVRGQQPYFAQVIARERPALLHAHFGPEGALALPLKRRFRLPLITTFYGQDMSEMARRPRWQKAYRALFAEGDCFLVEGSHMRESLVALGCPRERIRISHIGVDAEKLAFRARRKRPDEPNRLLMCGRLVEKKGVEYAIRAMPAVLQAHPRTTLRIVGDGPLRASLEALIVQLGLESHVRILGYLGHEAYRRELEQCHLFLAPSVTAASGDSEGGAPTVILEAQATGAPVIGSNHADIPEVIGHKDPLFIAPERDADALARSVITALDHPEKWEAWGREGRAHVEAEYDIRRVTEWLEQIYDQVREER